MFYDLSLNTWTEEEMKAVLKVLRSGNFTMGEQVDAFEKQFATKVGARYAVMTNSGSSANLIAVAALTYKKDRPLKRGDEVIVPAVAWATTYFPLQQYGLKIRLVDVDLNTLNVDVQKLEKAITPKTKMIVTTNLFGNPCQYEQIKELCKRTNAILFEDNCDGLGAEVKGRKCGTFGNLGTFSFFFSQQISTMEGGMIVTEDQEIYHLTKCLRNYGWTRALPPVSPVYDKREDDYNEGYRFIFPGYNVRPLELSAAAGTEQLKKLEPFLEVRRQNAILFREKFEADERFIIQQELGKSSWHGFTMILSPKWNVDRRKVFEKLREHQIAFRMVAAGNIVRHDVVKFMDHEVAGDLKVADIIHDRGFYVGNYSKNLLSQLDRLKLIMDSIPANGFTGGKAAA